MESPQSFLQVEAIFIMLLVLGITIVDSLIKQWTAYRNTMKFDTPVGIVNNTNYKSVPRMSCWIYTEDREDYWHTPIQRIRCIKYQELEQRVRIMTGVRRRLDQQF
ncbi:uncharacterized protein LOC6569153 [Drosophila grimshawi]|uniref:GH23069 n=1 Tax=Drosophila grimshawi TaxID=7222 RepID=B4JWL4_DROGR|nr:uncharacterized protein LOC6569153 [Drosophila grimshawi]EDV98352.1 GH23069 [Drosophila grimshawi]